MQDTHLSKIQFGSASVWITSGREAAISLYTVAHEARWLSPPSRACSWTYIARISHTSLWNGCSEMVSLRYQPLSRVSRPLLMAFLPGTKHTYLRNIGKRRLAHFRIGKLVANIFNVDCNGKATSVIIGSRHMWGGRRGGCHANRKGHPAETY